MNPSSPSHLACTFFSLFTYSPSPPRRTQSPLLPPPPIHPNSFHLSNLLTFHHPDIVILTHTGTIYPTAQDRHGLCIDAVFPIEFFDIYTHQHCQEDTCDLAVPLLLDPAGRVLSRSSSEIRCVGERVLGCGVRGSELAWRAVRVRWAGAG